MTAKAIVIREAHIFSRHVIGAWCVLMMASAVAISAHGQAWVGLLFPLASWGGMCWLTVAAVAIARCGDRRFDMAVAAEAIYALGIISILVAAGIGVVLILEEGADLSRTAFVNGLPKAKWLLAESVVGIGVSNALSTLIRILDVESISDGKGRAGGGGAVYDGDIDLSKIRRDVDALGEVLAQVHAQAKALQKHLENVSTSAATFSSTFSSAQKSLEQFTSASNEMTGEMRATVTLWSHIATLLASFDGFRLRKE